MMAVPGTFFYGTFGNDNDGVMLLVQLIIGNFVTDFFHVKRYFGKQYGICPS